MKETEKVPFDSMPPLIKGSFLTKEQAEKLKEPFKDVVLVVRCKDCKHKEGSVSPSWEAWCNRLHCGCDLDWFCADGERRDDV